jgi:peroxiredoxin
MGIIPQRITFIIDPQGLIRARHSGMFESSGHVNFAMAELRRLHGKSRPQ